VRSNSVNGRDARLEGPPYVSSWQGQAYPAEGEVTTRRSVSSAMTRFLGWVVFFSTQRAKTGKGSLEFRSYVPLVLEQHLDWVLFRGSLCTSLLRHSNLHQVFSRRFCPFALRVISFGLAAPSMYSRQDFGLSELSLTGQ
jgi:hypothetical protein